MVAGCLPWATDGPALESTSRPEHSTRLAAPPPMAPSARTLGAMPTPRPATHDIDTDPDPNDVATPDADDLDPDQLDHLPDARPAIDLSFLDDADPDEDAQP